MFKVLPLRLSLNDVSSIVFLGQQLMQRIEAGASEKVFDGIRTAH